MSDTSVGVEIRAVAAGVLPDGKTARITVVFRPAPSVQNHPAKFPAQDLQTWPDLLTKVMPRLDTSDLHYGSKLGLWIGPPGSIPKDPKTSPQDVGFDGLLEWSPPDARTGRRVLNLWQRAMAPDIADRPWQSLYDAIEGLGKNSNDSSLVLPTPDSPAALAFTLDRGRRLLDALAGTAAPIWARRPARDLMWARSERRYQIARRETNISDAPTGILMVDDDGLGRFRRATQAILAGEPPEPIWPAPSDIVAAALGHGDGLDPFIATIQDIHAATTPTPTSATSPAESELAKMAREAAHRRLGSLLASPVLQRVFGFAVDVTVPIDYLQGRAQNGLLELAVQCDPSVSTLARVSPPGAPSCFAPANRNEAGDYTNGTASWLGIANLGQIGSGDIQRYDLCTIDYAPAVENLINQDEAAQDKERRKEERQKKDGAATPDTGQPGSTGASPTATLRNGGLRLVDRDVACSCVVAPQLKYKPERCDEADDLTIGNRLYIGLRTKSGIGWRCPQYRSVTYEDPAEEDYWKDLGFISAEQSRNWLEKAISKQLGPPDGWRRLMLDAGTLQQLTNPTNCKPSSNAQQDKEVLIAFSTLAAWGGEPMGQGATGPGHRSGGRVEWSTCVIDDLDITRRYTPVPTWAGPKALNPMLRFGWAYHAAMPRVFEGGGSPSLDEVAGVAQEQPNLALPALGKDPGRQAGRRFLRHERIDLPLVLFSSEHWDELRTLDPRQIGADMIVRTRLQGVGAELRATRRILAAPPVPLQFAILHDVLRGIVRLRPPTGLQGWRILAADSAAHVPARLAPEDDNSQSEKSPYYPDPMASLLVIGLFVRDNDGITDVPLNDPVVIEVAAPWPNTLPVQVELKAATTGNTPAIVQVGWTQIPAGDSVLSIPAVEIRLRPGEDVIVQAWYAPTTRQLADGFDAIEAAGILATAAGQERQVDTSRNACLKGLEALLGINTTGHTSGPACVGAAGLPTTSAEDRRLLGGMLHDRILRAPLPMLAAPLTFRATHATATTEAPKFGDRPLMVTRRTFPGGDNKIDAGESRLDWMNGLPALVFLLFVVRLLFWL